MTPAEFELAVGGFNELEEKRERHAWARAQRLAYAVLLPNVEKRESFTYTSAMTTPFDNEQHVAQATKKQPQYDKFEIINDPELIAKMFPGLEGTA